MENLNAKQQRAVLALLSEPSVAKAAAAAQVGERTLYKWLRLPAFRGAVAALEGELIDEATRRLLAMQDAALSTIENLLLSDAPPSVRLRAAQMVIENLLKLRDLRNTESRLAALEAAYGVQGGGGE